MKSAIGCLIPDDLYCTRMEMQGYRLDLYILLTDFPMLREPLGFTLPDYLTFSCKGFWSSVGQLLSSNSYYMAGSNMSFFTHSKMSMITWSRRSGKRNLTSLSRY